MTEWHLLTGEYPPQPGGVSDYTRSLAGALAAEGDEVHVWGPRCGEGDRSDEAPRVTLHRLPDHFGPRGLAALDPALRRARRRRPTTTRLLVQYVPHMYGLKGMNLPFCLWLWAGCPLRPWVMFHEVRFPIGGKLPLRHSVLGLTQSIMASLVSRAAGRVFVSTPAWRPLIRRPDATWLPVPSNVPTAPPGSEGISRARERIGAEVGAEVIGHFGTFGGAIADRLARSLPPLLNASPRRRALLVGRGGERLAADLARQHPQLAARAQATGEMRADRVSEHLAACDLLVQPYPDGVTGRRTSLMAGLALGLPIVTTQGMLTEPLWSREGLARLVPAGDDRALIDAAERLLADPEARQALGRRARDGYEKHFSLASTVRALREADAAERARGRRR